MRPLLVFITRLILLALFTFAFVVLFEHGPANFPAGAKTEWNALLFFVGSALSKQEKAPAQAAPQAATTAAPSPAPKKTPQTGTETTRPATGTTPTPNR
jgi:hypothetical protein